MKKVIKKKNDFNLNISSIYTLDSSFLAFLKMNSCFLGFLTIMNLFINTFLLKASGNMNQVMIYNLILVSIQPFSMIGTVFILRRTSPIISQRIGFLLYGIAFATLAMLGEHAANYYWVIAILLSVAAGFYYVTYCLQIVSYTNDSNRDTASGIMALIGSFIALTLPLIIGFILSLFKGFAGYRILFIFVFFLSVLAMIFSTKLSPLNEFDNDKRVHFKEVVHALLRNKTGRSVMLITAIGGIREGTMSFFISVLIYQFIENEALVGINSFLGSIAAIVSASLYGLLVRPKTRSKSVYLSVTFACSAIVFLYFKLNPATLIAFNIVNMFLGTFIATPQANIYFSILQHLDSIRGKGAEVHTAREFFYGAGRVSGIVLTMLMPNSAVGSVTVILLLTAIQYISAFLIHYTQKQLEINFSLQ